MNNTRRLTKSKTNSWVFGVIGGIGEYFGLSDDVITFIRIAVIVLMVFGMGSPFFIYLILAIIMPNESKARRKDDWSNTYYQRPNQNSDRKIKEAEPINNNKDDWSDF